MKKERRAEIPAPPRHFDRVAGDHHFEPGRLRTNVCRWNGDTRNAPTEEEKAD